MESIEKDFRSEMDQIETDQLDKLPGILAGKIERFMDWMERDVFRVFDGYIWHYQGGLKPRWKTKDDLYAYWLENIEGEHVT